MDLIVDRDVLPVGADHVLSLAPQSVQGVEFRRTLRQPNLLDRQFRRPSPKSRSPCDWNLHPATKPDANRDTGHAGDTRTPGSQPPADGPATRNQRRPVHRFSVPKTTRRAFCPEIRTWRGCPRKAQPARNGGNNNRSVSSSANSTLRGRKFRIRARIRRFFLQLGIGLQLVPPPFPDIPQSLQPAPDGLIRKPQARAVLPLFLQQRDGPIHREVTELVGRMVHQPP